MDCGKCEHIYEKVPQYDGDTEYGCDLLSECHTVHRGMEHPFCPEKAREGKDG